MPTIFAANESSVLIDGTSVVGVRSIEYRQQRVRTNVYALGSSERIGMVSGPQVVEGRLTVASATPSLDALAGEAPFQLSAQFRHGDTQFTVTFDEPIEAASWTDHGLVVQAGNGSQVSGAFSYDPRAFIGTFVPAEDLLPGGQYVVTVGPVRDVAGNQIVPLSSWLVMPQLPTSLSLAASQSVVVPGVSVVLSGTASGLDGEKVNLEARLGSSSEFARIDQLTVAGGRVSVTVVPQLNTTYRLTYPGSAIAAPAASPEVRILVRRLVALVGVSPTTTRTVRAGSKVTLRAQVTPPGGGAHLSFRLYRYDATRRAYVYSRSFGRTTDPYGSASLAWTT